MLLGGDAYLGVVICLEEDESERVCVNERDRSDAKSK